MASSSAVPTGTTVTLNQIVEYAEQNFALAFACLPPSPVIEDIPDAGATRYHRKMVQIGTTILRNSGKLLHPHDPASAKRTAGKEAKQTPDDMEDNAVKSSVAIPASIAEERLVPVWAKFMTSGNFQLDLYVEGRNKQVKKEEVPMIAYLPQFQIVRHKPNRRTAFNVRRALAVYYLLSEGTLESFVEPKKCDFLFHLRRACIAHANKKEKKELDLHRPMLESGWEQHRGDLAHEELDQDMLELKERVEILGLEGGNKRKKRKISSDADATSSRIAKGHECSSIKQPDSDQGNLKILLAMTFDALHERDPDAARQIVHFSEEAFGRDLFKTLP